MYRQSDILFSCTIHCEGSIIKFIAVKITNTLVTSRVSYLLIAPLSYRSRQPGPFWPWNSSFYYKSYCNGHKVFSRVV